MRPMQLAAAANAIHARYPEALVFIRDDKLLVDVDRVWPDCGPDTLCEGSGEYRRVAEIDPVDGLVMWTPPPMHAVRGFR